MSRPECRVDGCAKESRGRGLCSMHWTRWRKHGDPNIVKRSGVDYQAPRTCSVDGCAVRAHSHGFCPKHLRRWQKHGDPQHIAPITGRPPAGEFPSYGAIHKRLTRSLGPARLHLCIDCGKPAQEWSYDGSDPDQIEALERGSTVFYSLDIERYEPRCVSCHRKHDQAGLRPRSEAGQFLPARQK